MRILVRAVVLVAGWAAYSGLVFATAERGGGANIGAGLLAFAILALVSALWGFLDARRSDDVGRLAVTWGAVGVVMGLFAPLVAVVSEPFDARVLALTVLTLLPFIAVLVLVPALAGGGLALLVGSRRAPAAQRASTSPSAPTAPTSDSGSPS